jgi:hypothetical protein
MCVKVSTVLTCGGGFLLQIFVFGDSFGGVWGFLWWCLGIPSVVFGDFFGGVWGSLRWCLGIPSVVFGDPFGGVWGFLRITAFGTYRHASTLMRMANKPNRAFPVECVLPFPAK